MAREVIISTWCDLCLVEDVRTEAEEMPPIGVGNRKARIVALCKQHAEDHYEPFMQLLNEYGEIADTVNGSAQAASKGAPSQAWRQPDGTRLQCPMPDCGSKLKNMATLASHLRGSHDTNMHDAVGKDGVVFDVEGNPVSPPPPRYTKAPEVKRAKCDFPGCDQEYVYPDVAAPTVAIGVHRARKHGIPGATKTTKKKAAKAR